VKNRQFELKIDAKLENLSVIADFIAKTMRQLDIAESIYEVQTAVDEACTNIIKHAYSGGEGIITVSCELQANDFVITIRDKGRPFEPSSTPPPDIDADLDERKIGGLGIYMMRKLMDDVSYSFDSEEGNKLVMRKRLTGDKRKY